VAWKLRIQVPGTSWGGKYHGKRLNKRQAVPGAAAVHHAKAVRNLLDSSGVRYIYLPPYSPDLNPIEKLWSKVKAFLRKFKARTLDALPNAIRCAFQTVSPSDCSGWFHSCGYSPYF